MALFVHNGKFIPDAPPKDPDSIIDYGIDWSSWLASGETLSTSIWVIPGDLTGSGETFTTTETKVFLSGGVVGTTYTLTNRITTNGGRTEDRSMLIKCQEK